MFTKNQVVSVLLVLVGVTQFLPVLGVLGLEKINSAYGINAAGPDLAILLRHRAVLFGILGGFLFYAAFVPAVRQSVLVATYISIIAFVLIVYSTPDANQLLTRLAMIDLVALVLAIGANIFMFLPAKT
jgi:hypothetical protein